MACSFGNSNFDQLPLAFASASGLGLRFNRVQEVNSAGLGRALGLVFTAPVHTKMLTPNRES